MKGTVRFEKKIIDSSSGDDLKKYSPLIQTILLNRGIVSDEEAERFLGESYDEGTHDPFLMKGMKEATDRIIKALKNKEKVAIFSDYDADGVPGAVVLRSFFDAIGFEDVVSYIPHRGIEGFGLNKDAVQELSKKGVTLMITVDCGITDNEEVEYSSGLGIDVIVTDHHLPADVLPNAVAILDPKQEGCGYPFKELCGAGVVYKLVQALILSQGVEFTAGQEKWMLDLVGLATIADMVPLVGENRIFARYGLLVLRKGRRPGLRELLSQAKTDFRNLTEEDVSFTLAPRINAASRMAHPDIAFELLFAKKREEALDRALALEEINKERKSLVARITKEVKKKFSVRDIGPIIVAGNPKWKPGILGLIAGSLADSFDRPAFVWGREGEEGDLKGSARSNGTVHIVELMRSLPEGTFINVGGHEQSGGFSISLEKVSELEELLNKAAASLAHEGRVSDSIIERKFDTKLDPHDIKPSLFEEVLSLAPFGVGFEKPIFKIQNAEIVSVKEFGKDKNHLEVCIRGGYGQVCNAIGFFMTRSSFDHDLEVGRTVTVFGSLEKSHFRGRREYRIRIEHLE